MSAVNVWFMRPCVHVHDKSGVKSEEVTCGKNDENEMVKLCAWKMSCIMCRGVLMRMGLAKWVGKFIAKTG